MESNFLTHIGGAWPTSVSLLKLDSSAASPLNRMNDDVFELFIPVRPISLDEITGAFNRKRLHYKLGSIGFAYPGLHWGVTWQGSMECALLIWEKEVIRDAVTHLFDEEFSLLVWRKAFSDYVPAIGFLGLDIVSQVNSDYPAGQKHVELLIEALLALCIRRYASTESRKTALAGITSKKALEAINFIDSKLNTDLSVEQICIHIAVSKSHLNRLFRTELGLSPWEYVQRQRIILAGRLLQTSKQNINDICVSLMFNSRSNFVGRFSKEYGCTPSEYRKKTTL